MLHNFTKEITTDNFVVGIEPFHMNTWLHLESCGDDKAKIFSKANDDWNLSLPSFFHWALLDDLRSIWPKNLLATVLLISFPLFRHLNKEHCFPTFFGSRHPYLVMNWFDRYKNNEILIFDGKKETKISLWWNLKPNKLKINFFVTYIE